MHDTVPLSRAIESQHWRKLVYLCSQPCEIYYRLLRCLSRGGCDTYSQILPTSFGSKKQEATIQQTRRYEISH